MPFESSRKVIANGRPSRIMHARNHLLSDSGRRTTQAPAVPEHPNSAAGSGQGNTPKNSPRPSRNAQKLSNTRVRSETMAMTRMYAKTAENHAKKPPWSEHEKELMGQLFDAWISVRVGSYRDNIESPSCSHSLIFSLCNARRSLFLLPRTRTRF